MNETPLPYAFFEGKIIPVEQAKVSIMTNALQYGNAIFGGIRGYISHDKKSIYIFRLKDHYDRFLNALKILSKTIQLNREKLMEITVELGRLNKPTSDSYFRPIAYASTLGISPDLSKVGFNFAMYIIPLGEYLPLSRGLRLMTSNWTRITDRMIPARAKISGGYVNSSLAKADASRLGLDDSLMLTTDGHIAEASAANFFIVRDGTLITPSVDSDILEGIVRKSIIELAQDLKIPIIERKVDRTEVYIADEAFLCGTGVQVAWIEEVDGRKIGNGKIGPITENIKEKFFNIIRGNEKKYSSWLTKV